MIFLYIGRDKACCSTSFVHDTATTKADPSWSRPIHGPSCPRLTRICILSNASLHQTWVRPARVQSVATWRKTALIQPFACPPATCSSMESTRARGRGTSLNRVLADLNPVCAPQIFRTDKPASLAPSPPAIDTSNRTPHPPRCRRTVRTEFLAHT